MRLLIPLAALVCACGAPSSSATLESPLVYPTTQSPVRRLADRIASDGSLEVTIAVAPGVSGTTAPFAAVRASIDGAAWQDLDGTPVGDGSWKVAIAQTGWSRIEYAAFASGSWGSGWGQSWDNNGGHNFVAESGAVVHRVGDRRDGNLLHVDLDVRNLAYDKQCWVELSTNGWIDTRWATGQFVGSTDRDGVERWTVDIDTSAQPGGGIVSGAPAVLDYAVDCNIAGQSYWDNDNGNNYRWERTPQPALGFSTRFDDGADLAVSDDGTTYVISGGRWLSAYDAWGRWQFARELPEAATTIRWLDRAGILLVQYASPSPRWAGVARDGRELWMLAAALPSLVETATAEYLIGSDGGARLGATAPSLRAPAGGCATAGDQTGIMPFPILSGSGRFYCTLVAGGIARIDLDSGHVLAKLTLDGTPWAADDAGNLVVLTPDRTGLVGYSPAGAERWRKSGLTVAPDTQYGSGAVCANHASGALAVHFNRPGSSVDYYIAGFDVATGAERFRFDPPAYGGAPCAAADGFFYQDPGYERYGRSVIRIATDGSNSRPNLGFYGALLAIRRNGQLLRREWGYYPNDRGRIVLTDAAGDELSSETFFESGSAQHRAAIDGDHLSILRPGELQQWSFPR